MVAVHRIDALPDGWGPCVVTIGVFDGVHRGHAQLIRRAVERARRMGLPAVLVTFDPHPALVVGPPRDVAALTSIPRRAELAGRLGIDGVCVLRFTPEFAQLSPAEFVERVLADTLHAAAVVVGANFTFGFRGRGTTDTLTELGRLHGIDTEVVGLVHRIDATCSSTAVRAALRCGDIRQATAALGRPHRLDVTVTTQADGEPVLDAPVGSAIPTSGRYFVRIDGSLPGVLSIDDHAHLHLRRPRVQPGSVGIEFIDALPQTLHGPAAGETNRAV
jgi:riboflavin kinase/FMN adenylyltransferase